MKKRAFLALAALAVLLLLAGCRAEPLPEGMEEKTVLAAGQEVAGLLLGGDYQAVYDMLREDIQKGLTAEDVRQLFEEKLAKAGGVKRLDDSRTQGSEQGEPHGIADLYYKCEKKTVLFRVAFDLEMNLIGLDPPKLI